jgi:ribosomal protein S12 methylthiotransferase accessory factor
VRRPALKRHLSVEVLGPRLAVLLSEVEHWCFEGPVYPQLLPLLDGTRPIEALMEQLRGYGNAAEIAAALLMLERSGHLASPHQTRPGSRRVEPDSLQDNSLRDRETDRVLNRLGIQEREEGDLTVVLTDEYLRVELSHVAEELRETDHPWIPLKPGRSAIWLGPFVHPPATPCWKCLVARMRANRPAHAWRESRDAQSAVAGRVRPRLRRLSVRAADSPWLRRLVRRPMPGSRAAMLMIQPDGSRSTRHVVVRLPTCSCCASADESRTAESASGRIELASRPRISTTDGGWRTVPPEQTFARHKHNISTLTGVVSYVKRRRVISRSLELYSAEHLCHSTIEPFPTARRLSSGKGVSRQQARASALCEALERYSGVFRGDEVRIRAPYAALGDAAVHPNACAHFSDAQFAARHETSGQPTPQAIPRPLDARQAIDWTPLWSLTHAATRYAPTEYCYYGYRPPADESCCQANSNGCAAGNNVEEAILQGFLELVERDAVAIWWYNQVRRPAVDLESFSQPFVRRMAADYRRAGRPLRVLDLTTDLEIPVFAALSERPASTPNALLLGFGAHLDAATALTRAITELNQWRCGVELGVAGASFSSDNEGLGAFLRRGAARPARKWRDSAPTDLRDIRDAIDVCVDRARQRGLETLVLDQTREDVGLSVVRVIVPGLRHFWPRFGPGRLYSVPVDLGWLPVPRTEPELNNFHILI